jgi:hypothetical protein
MRRQLQRSFDETLVDTEQSYRRPKLGDITRKTESKMVAAQDQGISINCFRNEKFGGRNRQYMLVM